LERLAQLVQQSDVVDRDGCLVRKSLNQSDLLIRKWPDPFQVINAQDTQQVVSFEYRYGKNGPDCLDIFRYVREFRISQRIENVDRAAVKHVAPRDAASTRTDWILRQEILELLRSVEGHCHAQQLAIEAKYHRSVSPT